MKKEVTVLEKADGKIYVGCDRNACEGCKGSIFCQRKDTKIELKDDPNVKAEVGEKVLLDLPSGKTIFSVFMSLGLPLLMFPIFYFVASFFTANEVSLFFSGIIGVAIGFIISAIFFHFKKGDYEPKLIGKS